MKKLLTALLTLTVAITVAVPALAGDKVVVASKIDTEGAFFFNLADSPVWKDAEEGYMKVKELDREKNNIVWLTPAPADNTWAIAVRKDLAKYVNSGGKIKLAGSLLPALLSVTDRYAAKLEINSGPIARVS